MNHIYIKGEIKAYVSAKVEGERRNREKEEREREHGRGKRKMCGDKVYVDVY